MWRNSQAIERIKLTSCVMTNQERSKVHGLLCRVREANQARPAQGFATLRDSVQTCSFESHKQNYSYLKHWLHQHPSLDLRYGGWVFSVQGSSYQNRMDQRGAILMERSLVMMIAHMIWSKSSAPHENIKTVLGDCPVVFEALFCAIIFLHGIRELPQWWQSCLALTFSRLLAYERDTY